MAPLTLGSCLWAWGRCPSLVVLADKPYRCQDMLYPQVRQQQRMVEQKKRRMVRK